MKWTHKGHQFDEVADRLKCFQKIYIWGAGKIGKDVSETVSFLETEICFIDRDENKRLRGLNQYPVISPETFEAEKNTYKDISIVVFAVGRYHYLYLSKYLLGNGYKENIDFFYYDVFLKTYLNIFSVYKFNRVYIEQMTQMVTTHCSLRCRNCMMSIPYLKDKKHLSLEQLKHDADLLFSKVDFIKYYGFGGGEIFLYPKLEQFITYIIDNYSKQIGTILLITNATILPNEAVLKVIAENNLQIRVSNYENVKGWNEKRDRFVEVCKKTGISYYEQRVIDWIDMGWSTKTTGYGAQHIFDCCDMPCREFIDGIEYYCMQGHYASKTVPMYDSNGEKLDFTDADTNKRVILEYNLGYSEKGYLDICAHCNGYFGINQQKIPVAEQI